MTEDVDLTASSIKGNILDNMEEQFGGHVHRYILKVKQSIKFKGDDDSKLFERAVIFLSQQIPDSTDEGEVPRELRHEIDDLKKYLSTAESSVLALQQNLQDIDRRLRQMGRSKENLQSNHSPSETGSDSEPLWDRLTSCLNEVTKTTEAQTSGPESLSVERTITPESATPPAQATPPECPTPVATSGQMTVSSEETPAETIAVTDPPKNSRKSLLKHFWEDKNHWLMSYMETGDIV